MLCLPQRLAQSGVQNAQRKKTSDLRRCKQCVDLDAVSVSQSLTRIPVVTLNMDEASDIRVTLLRLATRILAPDRIHGVPNHLRDEATLAEYLVRVLVINGARVSFLSKPLVKGLWEGHPAINERVQTSFQPPSGQITLLAWACQFRFLERGMGWVGGEDMISLILATPGIRVSETMENKTNAAFWVVKYGSPKSLEWLIDAGINMQQRDCYGRTLLFNALEYPNPEILRLVLQHAPATEKFGILKDGSSEVVKYETCADRIVALYGDTMVVDEGRRINGMISWISLGTPPPIQDVAEALIMVRQRGAALTAEGSGTPLKILGEIHRGEAIIQASEDFVQLGQSMLGFWLPPAAKQQVLQFDREKQAALEERKRNQSTEECSICLGPCRKRTTLFCGHTFCRECILDYGQTCGQSCPICREPLCKDLLPRGADRGPSRHQVGNLDGNFLEVIEEHYKNLSSLSDTQVEKEAKIQGLYSRRVPIQSLRNRLVSRIKEGFHEGVGGSLRLEQEGSSSDTNVECTMELSATHTVTGDETTGGFILSPALGPVVVEITIKGIPVVAHVSNNSRYTVVSSSLVDNFNLDRLEKLVTKEFRDGLTAKRMKNTRITCLKEFQFSIGGVDVTLRNSVEASPDLDGIGLQLGRDFFLSARFCAADVFANATDTESGKRVAYRCDGVTSWLVRDVQKESLRYYSHTGAACEVDLLHFNPNKSMRVSTISLRWDVSFTECNWCSRVFPEGMLGCNACQAAGNQDEYYCDEECQRAAYKLHKEKHQEAHQTYIPTYD